MKLIKLNSRFIGSPLDDNRIHGIILSNSVGSGALPWSGLSLGGGSIAAGAVAILDGNGNQITAANPMPTKNVFTPLNATTTVYSSSIIAKASAGTLYGLTGYNSRTSSQFIQIHDASSLPADTAVPTVILFVPANTNFFIDYGNIGRPMTNGIIICNSSTGPTKTIGSPDCWFDIQYL